ncbi:hypothetical protein niasHT_017738 [Heterodera trifolii]|uniref:Uncharacterized protein n=1 Tax=Heterodera trifolii TaxID=157864 RepID=A0ABD2L8C1_9BILA
MPDSDERSELVEMRGTANRLSDTLDTLLRRIEQLEHERVGGSDGVQSPKGVPDNGSSGAETRREYISWDAINGQRKLVTVMERVLPPGNVPLRVQSPTMLSNGGSTSPTPLTAAVTNHFTVGYNRHLLASAYESRIAELPRPELLEQLELEQICGQLVVVGITPEATKLGIRPGDTLLELDGRSLQHVKQLHGLRGPGHQLKLVLSDLYSAPMEFCKVLDDYKASMADQQNQLPYLSFALQRGDILQVLSRGPHYFQARKVNDLSTAGYVPASLVRVRPVAMLSPFGRRSIVLLGANGVGRRTLKRMLIEQRMHLVAGVVPVTSRAPKAGEQQGREYKFERKEDILQRIRDRQMIEWGEYNGALYGTTAESVREVVRSGRVCVLDCNARALESLYNAEFMPFVVLVAAPPFEELVQLSRLHGKPREADELRRICDQSDQLFHSDYAKCFDLVLVNRNRDISLRRLLDALEALKSEPQWVPLEWLQGSANAKPKS